MKTSIDKTNLIVHLTGFLCVIMALSDIVQSKPFMSACAALSVGVFILCFPLKNRFLVTESMIFVVFLLITSLINLFFTENGLGGSITLLGNLLLAYVYILVESKKMTPWIIAAYLVAIGYVAYSLFVLNTDPNDIYEGLSRNHAGFVVVFWTGFLLFHLRTTRNRFPLVLPILGLVISFFLFGRTSLIVSALLLLLVFFYKFKKNRIVLSIAASLLVVLCYYLYINFGEALTTETNLDEGLDTPRWELWRIYWVNLSPVSFFTGIDVNSLPMYSQFGGNPHNSFIKFHSRTGIGCIVFIMLFIVSVFKYISTKQYYVLMLLLLLTIRASFDSDILIGNFDFILMIITFYWIKPD